MLNESCVYKSSYRILFNNCCLAFSEKTFVIKMSFLNKTYTLDKTENYKDLLVALEVPDDQLDVYLNFKSSHTLKKEGDQYIESTTMPDDSNKVIKFKDGVEFDEEVAPGSIGKSKFTVEGDVITQIQTFGDGLSITSRREYSGDKLVMVITSNKCPAAASLYFTAA